MFWWVTLRWLTYRRWTVLSAVGMFGLCSLFVMWAGNPASSEALVPPTGTPLANLVAFLFSSGLLGVVFACGVLWNRISQLERQMEKAEGYRVTCLNKRLAVERQHGEHLAEIRPVLSSLQEEMRELRKAVEGT